MGKRVKIDMSSAKAEEPPQPQHPLRTASTNSMPNLPSERNSAAGVFPLLPEPTPGPPRRHTIVAPAEEPITQTRLDVALDGSVTGMPEATRPFFISPFPMGSKGAKSVANKVKVQDAPIRVATFGKRDTNTSAPSDATEVELTHELRLAEQRRRREFPRRLTTAVIGGIFAIAPMVIMSVGRTLEKSLITSAVAVLLFALTLAWCSTSDETSVFIATAGYAAFLAVFVAVSGDSASAN